MAWIESRGGRLHLGFRFGGRRFKKTLGTTDDGEAGELLARVERRLQLIELGDVSLPDNIDLPTYLLSDGKRESAVALPAATTLGDLVDAYFAAIPSGNLEETTLVTMRVHQRHLVRHFGRRFPLSRLTLDALQGYVSHRSENVGTTTIKKELATFRTMWNWGTETGRLQGSFPRKGLRFKKVVEKPPFRTRKEIERLVDLGTSGDVNSLWEGLYLDRGELDELVTEVEKHATAPFVYPMVVMAVHTGARRSELLRAEIGDVEGDEIVIRERKRRRDQHSTRRVPKSDRLDEVLRTWLAEHPGGRHLFGQPVVGPDGVERPEPITPNIAHDHLRRTLDRGKWNVVRGWHTLRHSFVSVLACAGVDQRLIDGFVGHTTEEMRRRYRHLFPSTMREALKLVF